MHYLLKTKAYHYEAVKLVCKYLQRTSMEGMIFTFKRLMVVDFYVDAVLTDFD